MEGIYFEMLHFILPLKFILVQCIHFLPTVFSSLWCGMWYPQQAVLKVKFSFPYSCLLYGFLLNLNEGMLFARISNLDGHFWYYLYFYFPMTLSGRQKLRKQSFGHILSKCVWLLKEAKPYLSGVDQRSSNEDTWNIHHAFQKRRIGLSKKYHIKLQFA